MYKTDKNIDLSAAKVLMVDDTPANIDVLRKVLKPEGYHLSFACGGVQAIKLATRALPDLILLDIMMPDLDGYMVCEELKSRSATRDIPIIFITAKTDISDLVKGFKLGAVDYIAKPFQQAEVCARVRTHLENRFLHRQQTQWIERLSASNKRFQQLATWMPVGVLQLDSAGRVTYNNAAATVMMSKLHYNCQQKNWWQMAAIEEHNTLETFWANEKQVFQEDSIEFSTHPDINARGYYRFRVIFVPKTDYWVATLEDITEQKNRTLFLENARDAAELELQHKADFLAGMTHELRTPMNAIIGYSEMLLDDVVEGETHDDLKKITEAGRYLLDLINNVLDLSKIDAKKMTLELSHFSIIDVLDKVQDIIKPLVNTNQNRFTMHIDLKEPKMFNDAIKLQQILFNLLSNACKFTQNGQISLNVHQEERQHKTWIAFTVKDTGIGLTKKQISHLFKKYTQVTNPAVQNAKGTGLGLVLSQQFSLLMGGNITVKSQPQQGTTFVLTLPQDIHQKEST